MLKKLDGIVLCLAFAQSLAFRIFFKMFAGIIVVAVAHGVILTPALMGECRFIYHRSGHHPNSQQMNAHSVDTKVVQMAATQSIDGTAPKEEEVENQSNDEKAE